MIVQAEWGQPLTIPFSLPKYATPEDYYASGSFSAGDVKLSKDGGAEANTTNLPATVGNGYTLALTAAEGEADLSIVRLVDSPTKLWMDSTIIVDRRKPDTVLNTKIASVISQVAFTLSAGSGNNNEYNNLALTVYDASRSYASGTAKILGYVGASKLVSTWAELEFTIANGDIVRIHRLPHSYADLKFVNGSAYAAQRFAQALSSIPHGTVVAGTLTTTECTTDLVVDFEDQYKDRALRFLSHTLANVETLILGARVSDGKLTFQNVQTPPDVGTAFIII